jgi:hypothetical protein
MSFHAGLAYRLHRANTKVCLADIGWRWQGNVLCHANAFHGAVHPPFPQWQNIFVNFGVFGWTTFPNGGIGQ